MSTMTKFITPPTCILYVSSVQMQKPKQKQKEMAKTRTDDEETRGKEGKETGQMKKTHRAMNAKKERI